MKKGYVSFFVIKAERVCYENWGGIIEILSPFQKFQLKCARVIPCLVSETRWTTMLVWVCCIARTSTGGLKAEKMSVSGVLVSALISFKLLSYRMLKLLFRTYFLLCKTSHFWTLLNPRKLTMKINHCRGFVTLRFYSALKIKVNKLDMIIFSFISTLKSRK